MDLVLYYNSLGSDLQQLHLTLQMTQVFMATSDKSITDLASTTGFWCPEQLCGYAAGRPVAPERVEDNIFWYEALTVLAAIRWAVQLEPRPERVAIFTDNLNTVQMFDSLRSIAPYTTILLQACELLMESGMDVRVWHIPGSENTVADALSRQLFHVVRHYEPRLKIATFEPPRLLLGERQQ